MKDQEEGQGGASASNDADQPKRRLRVVRDVDEISEQERDVYLRIQAFREALFGLTPKLFVTPAIVTVTIIYFAIMVLIGGVDLFSPRAGSILPWGANFGPATLSGEWWRLASCMFIHIGVLHLLFNMWVLWDLGQLVERLLGPVGFLLLYVISGIGGSIASVAWNTNVISAGASGAVFGVFGALMSFLVMRKDTIPPEILGSLRNSGLFFLVINLVLGFSIKGIDMAAHLGGLGVGFVCGLILNQPILANDEVRRGRIFRNLVLAVLGGGALVGGVMFLLIPNAAEAQSRQVFLRCYKEVSKAERALARASQMIKKKKLDTKGFAKELQQKVIPAWKAAKKTIDGIDTKGLSAKAQELKELLQQYASLTIKSLTLRNKAIQTNQLQLLQESLSLQRKAARLISRIEAHISNKKR